MNQQQRTHRRMADTGEQAHERLTDNDAWARVTSLLDRYKVFWLMAFAFGGWLGTRLTQPLSAVPVLQAQNAYIIARLDSAATDRKEISRVIKIFGKILCTKTTPSERYQYDIDCKDLPSTPNKAGAF